MSKKTLFWILLAADIYLFLSQTVVYGSLGDASVNPETDDGDATGDVADYLYSNTIGLITAVTSAQTVSQNGLQFIADQETGGTGVPVLTAYMDVGSYSIGFGCKPSYAGETITATEAWSRLSKLASAAANYVLSRCTSFSPGQNQLDALTDWVYQFGTAKVSTSQVWGALNSGDLATACTVLAEWMKVKDSNGNLVASAGIQQRRANDIALFNTPDGD